MRIAYPGTQVGQPWENVCAMNGRLPLPQPLPGGGRRKRVGQVVWGVEGPVGEVLIWIVGVLRG
jgi:hypothetical protein